MDISILELDSEYWFSHSIDIEDAVRFFEKEFNYRGCVDRDAEARRVFGIVERGCDRVYVIFGPRGCGKTTFFKCIYEVLQKYYSNTAWSHYQEPTVESIRELKDRLSREFARETFSESLISELLELANATTAIPFSHVVNIVLHILREVGRILRQRGYEHLIIILDEAYTSSVEMAVAEVKQFIEISYNIMKDIEKIYGLKTSIFVVTRYETIVNSLMRASSKCSFSMMWNLDKVSTEKLCRIRGHLQGPDLDTLYKITGGNPRELEFLISNGIRRWIYEVTSRVVMNSKVRELLLNEKYREALRQLVNNVDELDYVDENVRQVLLQENFIIFLLPDDFFLSGTRPKTSIELGIGDVYAWELPVYMYVFDVLVREPDLIRQPSEIARKVLENVSARPV